MSTADQQHRGDARALLPIAMREREEMVKLYTRLENNVSIFVDRSNHELAALAMAIRQKDENIATLQKMAEGYFVAPTPPVIAPKTEAPKAEEPKVEEPKTEAATAEAGTGASKPAPAQGAGGSGGSKPRRSNGAPPVVVTKVELEPPETPSREQ